MPTTSKVLEHYRECQRGAVGLRSEYGNLLIEVESQVRTVRAELGTACTELGAAYLGSALTPESIARAEQLTGYRGFTRRDPLKAQAHERTILANTVARIEADERYVRRTFLVGPAGELTRHLEECREMAAPWEEECARFDSLDGFGDLVREGYDTPAWGLKFWDPKYWRQWKQGDAICEALGLEDFGDDVLPAWRPLEAKRVEWRAQVAAAQRTIQDVHDLVEEHDRAVARIPTLPEVYREASASLLGEFLGKADAELLSEWANGEAEPDRSVLVALHRAAGLRAKDGFLTEIIAGVGAAREDMEDRESKYRRKITKFRRPKHRGRLHSSRVLDAKFLEKLPKHRKKRDKLAKHVERIASFEDYDSFDLENDPEVWWLVMTGKKPSSLTPTLRRWYDRNPSPTVRRLTWDDDGAAEAVSRAAAAAATAVDHGYVS